MLQFIDSDDKWRKCLLIDSDEEGTADFIKIDYLTEKYKTHHADKKLQDDFEEIEDGISCTHSAAPSKFEATSIAVDANDEARSPISPSTVASTAPSIHESTSDALSANEAEQSTISQRVPQPTTTTTQLDHKTRRQGQGYRRRTTCLQQRDEV